MTEELKESISVNLKLRPFGTPNYAIAEMPPLGDNPPISFHLSELSPGVLSNMCDEWRREVFKKAGRKDPRENF